MKKIILFIPCCIFFINTGFAEDVKIIAREEWGADESFTDINSSYWQAIIERRKKIGEQTGTAAQESSYEKAKAENRKRVDYVNANFPERYTITEKQTYNGDIELAWAVNKSKNIDAIILHHTATEYDDSSEGIKNIYRYHALSNEWGDIGYNYIIGYGGEIFEGRIGGDYAIGAHATWNNYSTLGIAIMGNYDHRKLNVKQYESLQRLLSHLVYKYDISMSKKIPLHHTCSDCEHGLETSFYDPIAGHTDGGHTSCPGENLYPYIESLNNKFKREQNRFNGILTEFEENVSRIPSKKIDIILQKISVLEAENLSQRNIYVLNKIKQIIDTRKS